MPSLVEGVGRGDRAAIGRAITLVESLREADAGARDELLRGLLPRAGHALRIGFTGVPGAGKSTLLEALGTRLCEAGRRVAVLAVDPSSVASGGSILGDKTRMSQLSRHPGAFVRPSASRGSLGGIAPRTRDAMTVLEAAGYDAVFVETVGVGQSEVRVRELVDTFVFLTIPNAGDELQGIKRGVLELAEIAVVHKCDGERESAARRAQGELRMAFHYMPRTHPAWETPVLCVSSITTLGLDTLWSTILDHDACLRADGSLDRRRRAQAVLAFDHELESLALHWLRSHAQLAPLLESLRTAIEQSELAPSAAASLVRAQMR